EWGGGRIIRDHADNVIRRFADPDLAANRLPSWEQPARERFVDDGRSCACVELLESPPGTSRYPQRRKEVRGNQRLLRRDRVASSGVSGNRCRAVRASRNS